MNLSGTKARCVPLFILGEDADLSEWLVHCHEPRFMTRVRDMADFTADELATSEELFIWVFNESAFTEFVWFDSQPDAEELEPILYAAADFIDQIDQLDIGNL